MSPCKGGKCDEGEYCEKHLAELAAHFGYVRHLPRHMVIDDEQSLNEFEQELRDAGR